MAYNSLKGVKYGKLFIIVPAPSSRPHRPGPANRRAAVIAHPLLSPWLGAALKPVETENSFPNAIQLYGVLHNCYWL